MAVFLQYKKKQKYLSGKSKYFNWIESSYLVVIETLTQIAVVIIITINPCVAQITPDGTLGKENSRVTPNISVKGSTADLIEGGAQRGSNLFHSFLEFNVNNGQRVYFVNPTGIENIFTRVTGNNPSNILGTLGVNGNANLFLLNPNGIVFGPNAQLDIKGSFFATTANSFKFSGGGEFSATNPQAPPLLTMSVPVGVQYGLQQTASITNQGNLSTGKDLTLSAGNLDLQGQLQAAGDLTLEAQDTLKVRDSATNPFIAAAGGMLLVQGNKQVDIFALNHPNSGFFSGGDLVLRSGNTVGGDAHYWAGGNFRIEQLDSNLGNLFSPHDPVIRASGDVSLDSYEGASLHILAGGSVNISGNINITGADSTSNSIQETVTLSNGKTLNLDGSQKPTLDIRSGVNSDYIGNPTSISNTSIGDIGTIPTTTNIPTNADITINGSINISNSGSNGGQIFITNQYKPNRLAGNITTRSIDTSGGDASIDSRGNFTANEINTSFSSLWNNNNGRSGDITITAGGNFTANGDIDTWFSSYPGNGRSGNITITAGGNFTANGINTSSSLRGDRQSGDITITAGGNFTSDGNIDTSSFNSLIDGRSGDITITAGGNFTPHGINTSSKGNGQGGDITIKAGGDFTPNGNIDTSSIGNGRSGDITIKAGGDFTPNGNIDTSSIGNGQGGDITIKAGGNFTADGINTSSNGNGRSGDITITAGGDFTAHGDIDTSLLGNGRSGDITIKAGGNFIADGINTSSNGIGRSGDITITAGGDFTADGINARSLSLSDDGRSGDITITAGGDFTANGINTSPLGIGRSGNITITAGGNFTTHGDIDTSSSSFLGNGQSGDITITAGALFTLDNVFVKSDTSHHSTHAGNIDANAGNIDVAAQSIYLKNGAQLRSISESGSGNAGNITINVRDILSLTCTGNKEGASTPSSIFTLAGTPSTGNGGNIMITTGSLVMKNGSEILANNFGSGANTRAGDITIQATGKISLDGFRERETDTQATGIASNVSFLGTGKTGGKIYIQAVSLDLTNSAYIASKLESGTGGHIITGKGGDINLDIAGDILISGVGKGGPSGIFALTQSNSKGDGGTINIKAGGIISLDDGAQVKTDNNGSGGSAGSININASDEISLLNGSTISSKGNLGNIVIGGDNQYNLLQSFTLNNSQIQTDNTDISQTAGNININASDDISLFNNSTISSKGKRGNILIGGISPPHSFTLNNSQIQTDSTHISQAAGNIDINASDKISLLNGSMVSSQGSNGYISIGGDNQYNPPHSFTIDHSKINTNGNNGNINIKASDEISLLNGSTISSKGNLGNIVIGGDNQYNLLHSFTLNNSQIQTDSTDISQTAGSININASDEISLLNGSTISSQGSNGYISIGGDNQYNLPHSFIIDHSKINTNGNNGNINIKASDEISLLNSSTISSKGNLGNIVIGGDNQYNPLHSFTLNNSQIQTDNTDISQTAGYININASDDISLFNNSTISSKGKRGNILIGGISPPHSFTLNNSQIQTDSTDISQTAGNININASDKISLLNGSTISSQGSNGNISIGGDNKYNPPHSFTIDHSTINTNGNNGNIKINANDEISLLNGSTISSKGNLGNIGINASTLTLKNNSSITTDTNAQNETGGDIIITAPDLLLLRASSKITTRGTFGNAGIITIHAKDGFVIAVPSEDSDILASAVNGNGGEINITANRVLGFQYRGKLNSTDLANLEKNGISDISASSDVGQQGQVSLNTLSIDPSQGLVALPTNLVDVTGLIAQGCGAGNSGDAKGQSEFVITGRGGLPLSPDDALSAGAVSSSWVNRDANKLSDNTVKPQVKEANLMEFASGAARPLVEAVGMVRNSNGDIVLTAQSATATQVQSGLSSNLCGISYKRREQGAGSREQGIGSRE